MAEVEPKDLLLFSFRYLKYGFLHPIHHENSTVARLIVYTVLALACSDFFIILHQTIFYPNIRMFLSNTEWAVAASSVSLIVKMRLVNCNYFLLLLLGSSQADGMQRIQETLIKFHSSFRPLVGSEHNKRRKAEKFHPEYT